MIKESMNGFPKIEKWILLDRLISDVLFENRLVESLQDQNQDHSLDEELVTSDGKSFNGRNLKNMTLTYVVIDPREALDTSAICFMRNIVVNYPLFFMDDPLDALLSYLEICVDCDTLVEPLVIRRRKGFKIIGNGPSGVAKCPTKKAKTSTSMRRSLGAVLEAKVEGSKKVEVFPS
ncbi:unnamed protein product [Vicia faba]|uniref:Uncharacterized protein n=1 Tax=Vicia faba TaxID=3906 RepID=A0AAV0ZNK5_VICFA|nr:unnamed protein product [Vicia faba]